jgi:hypothetical protein
VKVLSDISRPNAKPRDVGRKQATAQQNNDEQLEKTVQFDCVVES